MSSQLPPIQPGRVVGDRYRACEIIGRGGFSTIYRARQLSVGRDVALKVMRPDVGSIASGARSREELIERFQREARVIARLCHPATVTLFDFGRTEEDDFFMVLEYVDGTPLHRLTGRAFAPARVVRILEQALGSLGEAHEHGVIHRDVKPSNLMLFEARGETDQLRILDFGIAKPLEPTDGETIRKLTAESMVVGTPRYLAPEHATGRDPGPASDLYSLGLVAYELLLGERAIPGDRTMEILDRQLSTELQPAIEASSAVPDPLRHIVNRMIRKSREERYSRAEEVEGELAALPDLDRETTSDGDLATTRLLRVPERSHTPEEDVESSGESTTLEVVRPDDNGPSEPAPAPASTHPESDRVQQDACANNRSGNPDPPNNGPKPRREAASQTHSSDPDSTSGRYAPGDSSANSLAGVRRRPGGRARRESPADTSPRPGRADDSNPPTRKRSSDTEGCEEDDDRATFPPGETNTLARKKRRRRDSQLELASHPSTPLLILSALLVGAFAAITFAFVAL